MHLDWWTFALQTINFVILVWLLHRFLYKPVLRAIDARRGEIEKHYAEAEAAKAAASERLAAVAAERSGIAAEREDALKAAAAQAEEAAKARRARAEQEAAELLEAARKTLAAEREQALAEAQRASLDLGADVARRLLDAVPLPLRAEAWLERIERHLATLPKAELDALAGGSGNGAALTVVTAASLSAETAGTWRTRLHRLLGDRVAISFDVDPGLVAGADLHFPGTIYRFSWKSALTDLRSEADGHGDAR
jgi:F-type H+-transporting ATPase subunit b